MIFQDPMMTLNPVLRVDTQMIETVQAHLKVGEAEARRRARAALVQVGIASPDERLRAYPHQFSGGMRQRVAIAIALLHKPKLIVADEPTTALDVTIQGQILFEMQRLCRESNTALIWITHDLAVVAGLADRIAVMYAGRIVEMGRTADIIERPMHPYTKGLIGSVPSQNTRGHPLAQIPGMTPSLLKLPAGCAFKARCPIAIDKCNEMPALEAHRPGLSWRAAGARACLEAERKSTDDRWKTFRDPAPRSLPWSGTADSTRSRRPGFARRADGARKGELGFHARQQLPRA